MRLCVVFLFQILFLNIFSQTIVTELPIHFGQYFNNPQINPAKAGSKASLELYAMTRRSNDKFAGISTSAFSSFFRINSTDKSFNVLGLDFNNDKEGPFISRNRGYITYARHQRAGDNCFIAAGISMGLYSFGVKANPAIDAGISASTLDGNGGVWIYTENTRMGISVNQFNNGKVRPLDQVIKLNRHYTFIGEQKIRASEFFVITPSIYAMYLEDDQSAYIPNLALGVATNFLISNMVSFGASYENNEGFYSFIGIQNVCVACEGKKKGDVSGLSVDFSYFVPNKNNYRTNTQTYELLLRYYYGKTQKMQSSGKKGNGNAISCPDFK